MHVIALMRGVVKSVRMRQGRVKEIEDEGADEREVMRVGQRRERREGGGGLCDAAWSSFRPAPLASN